MKTLDERLDVAIEGLVDAACAYGKDKSEAETVLRLAKVLARLMDEMAREVGDDLELPKGDAGAIQE